MVTKSTLCAALLVGLSALIQGVASNGDCHLLSLNNTTPNEFLLSTTDVAGVDCMTTPPAEEGIFELTILADLSGQYKVSSVEYPKPGNRVFRGYHWSPPSIGIFYCVGGDTNITFEEFVEGATIEVIAKEVASEVHCTANVAINQRSDISQSPPGLISSLLPISIVSLTPFFFL